MSLRISDEVTSALNRGKPVVALESTIISHGMPYPQNLETAHRIENLIREKNVTPATIAVIDGEIRIGLSERELKFLSESKSILKASRKDLPAVIVQKLSAATTVSGTMFSASLAGIKIFATGGIGGVHRNAGDSFDISADLTELSRTKVAVVSSGVKSILDIGLTLEYLETLGVPVIGFRTKEFPAFYTRESGFSIEHSSDSPEEVAQIIKTKFEIDDSGGMLIANPVPEEFSFDKKEIDDAIESALEKASQLKISGKEVTPFLLSEISAKTNQKSLESNRQLVFGNASLAAEIAIHL